MSEILFARLDEVTTQAALDLKVNISSQTSVNIADFGGSPLILDNMPYFRIAANYCIAHNIKKIVVNSDLVCSTSTSADQVLLADISLVGSGSVTGIFRKTVIPPGSFIGPEWALSDVIPSRHLKRINGTANPKIVIVGDSRGTFFANSLSRQNLQTELITRKLQREFPGATIVNRSLGGASWATFRADIVGYAGTVPWVSGSATWSSYVAAQTPDLVIFMLGMNYNLSVRDIYDAYQLVLAYTKVPDILFVTPEVPSLKWDDVGTNTVQAAQSFRDKSAGMVRSFARFYDQGVVDLYRQERIARDGVDPFHSVSRTASTGAPGYVTPTSGKVFNGIRASQDFKAVINFNTALFGVGGNDYIWVQTGPDVNTEVVTITPSGGSVGSGFYKFDAYAGIGTAGALSPTSSVTSSKAVTSSGTDQIVIEKYGDEFIAYEIIDGSFGAYTKEIARLHLIVRAGDFTPMVYSPGGSSVLTSVGFTYSEPRKSVPTVTDSDLFGIGTPGVGEYGGSIGGNHSAEFDGTHVISAVLDAQAWRGGNFNTIGAWSIVGEFSFVGTLTGNTTLTFPTTGTLATRAGTETFSNKTLANTVMNNGNVLSWKSTAGVDGGLSSGITLYVDDNLYISNNIVGAAILFRTGAALGTRLTISSAGDVGVANAMSVGGAVVGAAGLTFVPPAAATPAANGQLTFQATSNTSLTFKYKGSDGVVRSGSIVLA